MIRSSAVGNKVWLLSPQKAKAPSRAASKLPAISEAALHKSVADYLRAVLKPPAFFTTFPAGGGGYVRGAKLKAAGLMAGMPDLLVFWSVENDMGYPEPAVLGLELKARKGTVSPDQKAVAKAFDAIGAEVIVCRSIDDVSRALDGWAVPTREAA